MIKWYVSKNGARRYYRPIDALRFKIVMTAILNDLPMPYQCTTVKRMESDAVRPGFGRGFLEVV